MPYSFASCTISFATSFFVVGNKRLARFAPATASAWCSDIEGRDCITSIGVLPKGSRMRSAQALPIARSTVFRSAAVKVSGAVACAPLRRRVWALEVKLSANERRSNARMKDEG
jgi:hypothetical protein